MLHGPVALGVKVGVEVLVTLVQNLVRLELVEPQQPVRLIKPMLPQQRGLGVQRREAGILGDGDVGRVKHPLEAVLLVHPLGQLQDMVIRLRRGSHDHLGALPGGGKLGRFAVEGQLLPVGGPLRRDLLHGAENGVPPLVRGQQLQAVLAGQLDIDAQPVGQKAQLFQQLRAGAGDGLGVDVPAEVVLIPQQPQGLEHPLGGVVRVYQHRTGQKQPLDVVAAVEFDGQLGQLPRRKGRAGDIIRFAVDAVAAIKGAAVGHQHLQQTDTPAIGGKGVAAARRVAAAETSRLRRVGSAAGRTGHIIFCTVR